MADETENLTVHIRKGLREDMRSNHDELRSEIASVRQGLTSVREELRETRETLSASIDANTQRIVETELRVATDVADMHGTLRDVLDVLAASGGLVGRVAHLERDVAKLKAKVGD